MRRAAGGLVVVTFMAAGCGKSEEDKAGDAVKDAAVTLGDKDGEKFCSYLTGPAKRELIKNLRGKSCPALVNTFVESLGDEELDALKDFKVKSVDVKGDRATVTTESSPILRGVFGGSRAPGGEAKVVKVGGEWKIPLD